MSVDANNKLGTVVSSARLKEDIKPVGTASQALFALNPVTFHYKKEIDPVAISQFGLVAEEVEKVNPDLVVRDKDGKPYSVCYDQVNSMPLNEFLKEHKKVEEQQIVIAELWSTIAQQQKIFKREEEQIAGLTFGVQKLSAQMERQRSAPTVVANNR